MSDSTPNGRSASSQIIDDSMETYKLCRQAMAYCLDHGGELVSHSYLKALEDCADINHTLALFMTRASRFFPDVARLCSTISAQTAEIVSAAGDDHAPLKLAYVVSLRAAKDCGELLTKVEGRQERRQDEALRDTFPASDPPAPPTEI